MRESEFNKLVVHKGMKLKVDLSGMGSDYTPMEVKWIDWEEGDVGFMGGYVRNFEFVEKIEE